MKEPLSQTLKRILEAFWSLSLFKDTFYIPIVVGLEDPE
jgi:hypothetical protein